MNLSGDARLLWDAALGLNRAVRPVSPEPRRSLPPLLFFTDPARTPEPWKTAERLPEGAAVVYRSFGVADAEAVARRLRAATADRGVRLLIGLDADLAQMVGADGVHLPERALTSAALLRSQHPHWLLTAAIHAADDMTDPARRGLDALGLDALVLSPVFAAGGASAVKPVLGVEAFSAAVRASLLPVYGLGGVGPKTVASLTGTGACGIAGVDAIVAAFS
ncbi:MAG: thiamine phosphate synthase [Brevundimonas sp.]|nr:thiamine phosphate synthase [Brevundimonas sp.]